MPAPRKHELEKVSDLSGFTLKRRLINYIETIARMRGAKRSDILAEMVEYYMENHPVAFVLGQRKDHIRAEAKKLREDKARYEIMKKLVESRCSHFVQANYGHKTHEKKDAEKIFDTFKNNLEMETGLEPMVVLDIYERVCEEYNKQMQAQNGNIDSAPQNDKL